MRALSSHNDRSCGRKPPHSSHQPFLLCGKRNMLMWRRTPSFTEIPLLLCRKKPSFRAFSVSKKTCLKSSCPSCSNRPWHVLSYLYSPPPQVLFLIMQMCLFASFGRVFLVISAPSNDDVQQGRDAVISRFLAASRSFVLSDLSLFCCSASK